MVLNFTRPAIGFASLSLPAVAQPVPVETATVDRHGWEDRIKGMNKKDARAELRRIRKSVMKDVGKHDKELAVINRSLGDLNQAALAFTELTQWVAQFLRLERPQPGAFASLRKAFADHTISDLRHWNKKIDLSQYDTEIFNDAIVFMPEHDWFSAVSKADDFNEGAFVLPFDVCAFEFRLSGRRVVTLAINTEDHSASENRVVIQFAVEGFTGWMLSPDLFEFSHGTWEPLHSGRTVISDSFRPLLNIVGSQIRAVSIALDAEVATSTAIRVPSQRIAKDQAVLPAYECRTLSLARRDRPAPFVGGATQRHKRLHFRRGHWRHLMNAKTWVRWCLVGDPDLGFIEKQYRL